MGLNKEINKHCKEVGDLLTKIETIKENSLVWNSFYTDFEYRFCWASNSLEGNTLSLNDTIGIIDFDEVRNDHSYKEYTQAKALYNAIKNLRVTGQEITESWLKENNGIIISGIGEYRVQNIVSGSLVDAKHRLPDFTEIPKLMEKYLNSIKNGQFEKISQKIEALAVAYLDFLCIHPFAEGNGKVGRLLFNQLILNYGLLPVTYKCKAKYKQALSVYEKTKDTSPMIQLICDEQKTAVKRLEKIYDKIKKKE